MAEQLEVEFDLDPVALADLMARKTERIWPFGAVGFMVVAGALAGLGGNAPDAFLFFFLAVISTVAVLKAPKQRQAMALRLAGHTKIVLSDEGMDFRGANVAERVPWARFRFVSDRPEVWTLMTKTPTAMFFIPKSAVPAPALEQLTAQLMDWSGAAYKFRKR